MHSKDPSLTPPSTGVEIIHTAEIFKFPKKKTVTGAYYMEYTELEKYRAKSKKKIIIIINK